MRLGRLPKNQRHADRPRRVLLASESFPDWGGTKWQLPVIGQQFFTSRHMKNNHVHETFSFLHLLHMHCLSLLPVIEILHPVPQPVEVKIVLQIILVDFAKKFMARNVAKPADPPVEMKILLVSHGHAHGRRHNSSGPCVYCVPEGVPHPAFLSHHDFLLS